MSGDGDGGGEGATNGGDLAPSHVTPIPSTSSEKSNQEKKAMLFDKSSVQSQLQTGGVITAVEVSRSGFGVREKHSSFLESYAGLLKGKGKNIASMSDKTEKDRCELLLQSLDFRFALTNESGKSWAVGKNLVFLKQSAYDTLEEAKKGGLGCK